MKLHPRSALLLASAALLAACGGRSQLRDTSASSASSAGGDGPTTSSVSASSGGGFGGNGGAESDCYLDGAPIGIAGTEGYLTSNPILLRPGQSDLTTLIAGWTANEGPTTPPTELRHTSFQPWDTWPADATIGPSYLGDYDGGVTFVAATAPDGFAAAFADSPPSPGLSFVGPFVPGEGTLPGTSIYVADAAEPLFVVPSDDYALYLLGFSNSKASHHVFNISHLSDALSDNPLSPGLGCALDPIVAGAAAIDEGFLVAFSSGSQLNDPACLSDAPIAGAKRLIVVHVDKSANVTPTTTIEGTESDGPISAVKMVSRADGAWLAWAHQLGPRLRVARLDIAGKIVKGPYEIPFFGDAASLSASNLAQRLALAWSSSAADASPQVRINVITSLGTAIADVTIPLGPPSVGRTAILDSPSSDGLLVSWVQQGATGSQLQLARLACDFQ